MSLTIITGTHSFIDLTGKFRNAFISSLSHRINYNINGVKFSKTRFERVLIDKSGNVITQPSRIFPDRHGLIWSVTQPTGSGKTILAVYHLYQTWVRGGNISGNISFKHFKLNEGQDRDKWQPSIKTIDDLIEAKNTRVLIDDIKGTIERWQAKEADIVTMAANLGRKERVDIDITTQRVINYIPPNIRAIATGYEIPYITIRDMRNESPDGRGYPVEMEIISLIPGDQGDIFVGFGCLNGDIPDGKILTPSKELLESYHTMEISTGLRQGEGEGNIHRPGYDLELEAFNYLNKEAPSHDWQHLNGKHIFDIVGKILAIDVVGLDTDGDLYTEHKNMMGHVRAAGKKNLIPYLMFKYKKSWGFLKITGTLIQRHKGNRIDMYRMKVKTLKDV